MSVIRQGLLINDDGSIQVYLVASGAALPSDAIHVDGKLPGPVPATVVRPDGSLVARQV